MRSLHLHRINGVNRAIAVQSFGAGRYRLSCHGRDLNVPLQRGRASEGRNGWTVEALLALCLDHVEAQALLHPSSHASQAAGRIRQAIDLLGEHHRVRVTL